MTGVRIWFAARTVRERRLILAMLALLLVTLVWIAVITPIRDGLSAARTRYETAVIRLGAAQAEARAVKLIQRGQPAAVPLPLAETVRARASAAGLSLITLEPQGTDRVHLAVAGARAGAVAQWLAELERDGLLVNDTTFTAAPDGSVSLDATLVARAP